VTGLTHITIVDIDGNTLYDTNIGSDTSDASLVTREHERGHVRQ
jgi:hypothetical protein